MAVEKKSKLNCFKIKKSEDIMIKEAASKTGKTVSDFVRSTVMKKVKKIVDTPRVFVVMFKNAAGDIVSDDWFEDEVKFYYMNMDDEMKSGIEDQTLEGMLTIMSINGVIERWSEFTKYLKGIQ